MGQVLNQRDFYYGAFIFALLNKKIRPAAIVESGDDCHQVIIAAAESIAICSSEPVL